MKRNKNQVSHDASFAHGLFARSGKTAGCNLFAPVSARGHRFSKNLLCPSRRTVRQFYLLLSEAARLTHSVSKQNHATKKKAVACQGARPLRAFAFAIFFWGTGRQQNSFGRKRNAHEGCVLGKASGTLRLQVNKAIVYSAATGRSRGALRFAGQRPRAAKKPFC